MNDEFAPREIVVLAIGNSDENARGLAPERAQVEAGRIMLERVHSNG